MVLGNESFNILSHETIEDGECQKETLKQHKNLLNIINIYAHGKDALPVTFFNT